MEALQKVDDDNFDFSLYDRDGNGTITPKELVTMVAFYQDTTDGFVRTFPNYVTNDGVTLDNSNMPYVYLPDFQTAEETGVMAHELAHVLINAGDMYEDHWDASAPGPYSLMDQHSGAPRPGPLAQAERRKLVRPPPGQSGWLCGDRRGGTVPGYLQAG